MGRHSGLTLPRAQLRGVGGDVDGRHVRTSWSLPLFATFASLAFVAVTLAYPNPPSSAVAIVAPEERGETQSVVVAEGESHAVVRDAFKTSQIYVAPSAPAAGIPDPGTAKAIAYDMLLARGWGESEYNCLVALWERESHWNVYAHNGSSGAYGIPQALPGNKMASAGADWATNPATQITWGLGYIGGRYGTPCGAWDHSNRKGWY